MCRSPIPGKKNPLQLPGICAVLALTFALFLSTGQAYSAQLSVAWNPGTGPIAGYNVYYGVATGQYTNSVNAGNNLSATLQNLSNSTYYIAARDYDANNDESSFSTELVVQPVTASAGTGGSIIPSGTFFVTQGANQTFSIAPSVNCYVADVQVNGHSVGPVSSYTLTSVSAAHSITATFAANAPSYTITASAGANGSISPSGPVSVAGGASQTFTITPATGYHVASVTVDGFSVGAVTTYPFSNVTGNHTISATFVLNTYTITPTAGANGTISPSSAVTVNSGASQTFTITPATGYQVASVAVDGSSVGTATTYPFSNVTANHTIAATFVLNTYTITPTAGANGTISPSSAVTVNSGASQTFTITPATGYQVASVTVDGSSVGTATSYPFSNVTANHTISATFAVNTYTITPTAGANGTISPSSAVTVNSGASQTFTITPASGYHVASLTVDGSSAGTATTYPFSNVTANHTISATFAVNTYTITPTAGANGTISPSSAVTVNSGASQTFTITPASGYHVATLTVDGSSAGAATSYPFSNVAANHTISATFAINTYTITPTAGANGTISPSSAVTVNPGASQTFTITPAAGYHVASVTVDGSSAGAVTTYPFSNVAANHTISATFASNTYTITASAGANGKISPSGTVSVAGGAARTFSITPRAGYQVAKVTVDGSSVGAVTSYPFNNVAANHTISATFSISTHNIRAFASANGSISPSGNVSVVSGKKQAFTITPAPHYQLAGVLVNGEPIGAVSSRKPTSAVSYAFTNVAADHTIQAIFAQVPPPVADAGPDQAVKSGSVVTLNGSNSTDAVSGIASYKWTQASGPAVKLSKPSASICTFTAPSIAGGKTLAFNLTVTNKAGVTGSASCLVNVSGTGQAPSADAGPDQTVQPYANVTLDASGSSDPDGAIASYNWVQINGPSVEILNANTAYASFVAPDPGPLGASLVFQLLATDQFGLTTRDQCTVNVVNADPPPVANAGSDQTAAAKSSVTLDGSGVVRSG